MSRYQRIYRSGATYFFTVNLADRRSHLLTDRIDLLRAAYRMTTLEHPVACDAIVVLPDHLHAVWTLPPGDADFSERWRKIKARFSHGVGQLMPRSASKVVKRETGVWQRRFWEHCIRDDADYASHVAYCWGNPVKHGVVERAVDWPFSSIHRDLREGRVPPEWGGHVTDGDFGERRVGDSAHHRSG
jgi:putative transposase